MYKVYRPGETIPREDREALAREIKRGDMTRFMANVSHGALSTDEAIELLRANEGEGFLSRFARAIAK